MAGASTTIIVAQAETTSSVVSGDQLPEDAQPHGTTEVESEVFPPFDPVSFGPQLVWLALAFIILYVGLSRAALPRIGNILEARRTRIEGDLKEAERLRLETDKAVAAYEKALSEARQNAQRIAEETRNSIRGDIDEKRKGVETDLSSRMAEAEARIQSTKTAALGNVDAIAAETAQALVERLSGSVSEADALAAVRDVKGAV